MIEKYRNALRYFFVFVALLFARKYVILCWLTLYMNSDEKNLTARNR